MREKTKRTTELAVLFASFMFLQLTVLWMGNHAGEGYLPVDQREMVYYILQVFAILGFLAYAAARGLLRGASAGRGVTAGLLAVFFAGAAALLLTEGSRLHLAVTYATVLCLGCLGGMVYERMSGAAARGEGAAWSMGVGCATAYALQYFLQLRRSILPLLAAVMLAAFVLLARALLRETPPAAPASEGKGLRRLLIPCLIAATLLLFTSFYNGYIHHLQVVSGYGAYNVYSWPRLMLVPCFLFFGLIGDRRQGRLVPIAALCIALAALLNSALVGNTGAYWLNMCLFYCALAGVVAYYDLTFWWLAPGTKHPALWASMGRILDSAVVLFTGLLRISALPAAAILSVDVAGLAVILVLMAVNGDFIFAASAPEPAPPGPPDREDRLAAIAARCGLSPAEARVLRELVLTEDKQAAIAERLSIRVSTVQHHTTAIYRKTGASTRAGLSRLYHDGAPEEPPPR